MSCMSAIDAEAEENWQKTRICGHVAVGGDEHLE